MLFMGNKTASNYDDSNIEVLSLKTGTVKVVQRGGYFGRYLATSNGSGYLVYIHESTLFGVPFDLDRLEVRGTPVPLLEDVAGNSGTAGGQLDFSHNGTFVYLSGKSSTGTWTIAWLDSAGKTQPLLAAPGLYLDPRFSPDGKRLAFSNGTDIEIYDWGRQARTRLTFTAQAVNLGPVWTPDGKRIVFESQGTNKFSLQWIRADGGEAQSLLESKSRLMPYSFSPDGKRLAFSEQNAETWMDLWTLPLDTSDPEQPKPGKPELFLRKPFAEQEPAFSPDGRWIAYTSTESGRLEVCAALSSRRAGRFGQIDDLHRWRPVADLVAQWPGTVLRRSGQPHYGRLPTPRRAIPLQPGNRVPGQTPSSRTSTHPGISIWRRTGSDLWLRFCREPIRQVNRKLRFTSLSF